MQGDRRTRLVHRATPWESAVVAAHVGMIDPLGAALEAERGAWYEVAVLVRSLTPEECLEPGYQHDPDWTVRDLVAHLGTWLAEAEVQFERMTAGTYEGHDIDVDALNAALLAAMQGQSWETAWVQANAARTRMIDELRRLPALTDEVGWWVAKSADSHYAEHLARLREWTAELTFRRGGPA
jgi:hypothetical protein